MNRKSGTSKSYKTHFQVFTVFILALVQYSNTFDHDYAWDDAIVLTENTRVQKGLSDIPELFENIKTSETQNRYGYRPIALLSFATDVEFFGMDPKAAHKISVLLYALVCVLIYFFLRRLFPHSDTWAITLVTLIFALHPLHTEVVANIKSRDEILALGFGLAGLLLYLRVINGGKTAYLVLSCIMFCLAFLSKESAVTFCGVAFLLPWFMSKQQSIKTIALQSIPALIFLAVLVGIRAYVYSEGFFQSTDIEMFEKGSYHEDGFVGNPLFDATFSERIATAIFLLSYFMFRFVVPFRLLHDYSYNQFPVMDWSEPFVWVALLTLVLIASATVYGIWKRSTAGFGLAFFIVTASIYLHIVQIAPDIFGERFLFVPSLGLCIVILGLFNSIKNNQRILIGATVVSLLLMFGYTWDRNKAWKDNDTLLSTDLPHLKACARANYNYALYLHREYYKEGNVGNVKKQRELIAQYEHVVAITDRILNAQFDLGGAYMEFGEYEKGYELFTEISRKYPKLSAPFVQLGKYYMTFSDFENAIPMFEKALENGSKNSDYHYLLSICLFNTEQHQEAIRVLLEGEKLGVSSSAYHSLIARLYRHLGETDNAIEGLKRGLKLYPNDQGLIMELRVLLDN